MISSSVIHHNKLALFLNRRCVTFEAGAVRYLVLRVLRVGFEPTETKRLSIWGLTIYHSEKSVKVKRMAQAPGHVRQQPQFHVCVKMRLLAEMFDFQINTIQPLHCAEAAHHVKPIWNYE